MLKYDFFINKFHFIFMELGNKGILVYRSQNTVIQIKKTGSILNIFSVMITTILSLDLVFLYTYCK